MLLNDENGARDRLHTARWDSAAGGLGSASLRLGGATEVPAPAILGQRLPRVVPARAGTRGFVFSPATLELTVGHYRAPFSAGASLQRRAPTLPSSYGTPPP